MENKFNIRQIKSSDVIKMTSILSKVGIRNFKDIFDKETLAKFNDKEADRNELALSVGIDIVSVILESLEKCEQPLYKFLGSLIGMTKEEVAELPGADFLKLLEEVFTSEDMKDFFKAALRLLK